MLAASKDRLDICSTKCTSHLLLHIKRVFYKGSDRGNYKMFSQYWFVNFVKIRSMF